MAGIEDVLYTFRADAGSLLTELRKLERRLKELPDEETVVIKAETDKALADLEKFEAAVKTLEEDEPEVAPKLNLRKLLTDVNKAKAALKALPNEKVVDVRIENINIRRQALEAQFKQIEARVEQLKKSRPQVVVDARIEQASARLKQLELRLAELRKKKVTPKIEADISKAEADIEVINARMEQLAQTSPQIRVDANIAKAEADLLRILAQVELLDQKEAVIKVEVDRSAAGQMAKAEREVSNLIGGLGNVGSAAKTAAIPFVNLGGALSSASGFLRRLGPLVSGAAIAITGSLVPALLALGAAFGGAIAGAGALASALAVGLIPAVVAAVGIFGRISAVMDVFKAKQQAQQQATKESGQAAKQAAQNEATLRNARRAALDATRNVQRAEEDLAQARRDAGNGITDAANDLADARRSQAQAAQNLARAEVEAYREIRDAIEAASDAVRDYARAKLDAAQAKLDVRQSLLDLKKLRAELGATGDEFGAVFQKFSDVSVDVSGLTKALEGAAHASGTKLSVEDQLKLEQAILNVRKARQNDKDAIDGVSDAQRSLNDKTAEADRLRKTGIAGVEGYRSALEGLRSASETTADAQKKYNDLVKAGIEGAPGVIAAHQALGDAIRNEKRQLQDLAAAKKAISTQETASEKTMSSYEEKRKKLTKTERGFLAVIEEFKKKWDDLWKSAGAPVISALTTIIAAINTAMPSIKGPMTELTTAWGDTIRAMAVGFTSPKNIENIGTVFDTLKDKSDEMGGAITNAFSTLTNVGAAASPLLGGMADDVERITAGWAQQTADTGKLTATLKPMVDVLTLFTDIVFSAGDALLAVFNAASGPINEFVTWIRDGVKAFGDWAKSAEGSSKIKKFFEETLPLAKSIIKFLVRFGALILKAFEFAAPILKPMVDMFTGIIDVLNFLYDILLKIPAPIRSVVGWVVSFFLGLGKVTKVIGLVSKGLGKFPSLFGALAGIAKKMIGTVWKPIREFFVALGGLFRAAPVRKAFTTFWNAIKKIAEGFVKVLGAPFRALWRLAEGIFKKGKEAVGRIFKGLVDIFKSVLEKLKALVGKFTKVWDDIKKGLHKAFDGIKGFVGRVFGGLGTVIKKGLNVIIDGVNLFIRGINKITGKLGGKLAKKIGFSIPQIPEIPTIPLAAGGVVTREIFAKIGEAGREAVLPLNRAVYKELAAGIVSAMNPSVGRVAVAGAPGGSVTKNEYHIDKIVVATPSGALPDPRATAVALGRELERRGG